MKNIITFSVLLFSSCLTFAQTGFFVHELHHDYPVTDTTEIEQILETYIKNTSTQKTTFKWERKTLCTDPNYGNSVCIGSLCYDQFTSTRTFDLEPGDSTAVSSHLWKNGHGKAYASIEVLVYPVATPTNSATMTFKFSACTSATTPLGDFAAFEVYPNPANLELTLQGVADAATVEVFNYLGVKVYTQSLDLQGNALDVSGFEKGNYLVRVLSADGKLASARTFLKL